WGHTPTEEGCGVRIEIRGRNTTVPDGMRAHVEKCFATVSEQVSERAQLDLELAEEKHRSTDEKVAEATLRLKGVTLRAREASSGLQDSVDVVGDTLSRH